MQGCAIPALLPLRWSSQLVLKPSRLVFLGQSVGKRAALHLHLHLHLGPSSCGPLTNTHDRRPQPTAHSPQQLACSAIAPVHHPPRLIYSAADYPSASAAPPLAHPSPLPTVFAPRISAPFAQQPQRQTTRHDRRTRHRSSSSSSSESTLSPVAPHTPAFVSDGQAVRCC
jgi:hypothetical protein